MESMASECSKVVLNCNVEYDHVTEGSIPSLSLVSQAVAEQVMQRTATPFYVGSSPTRLSNLVGFQFYEPVRPFNRTMYLELD